MCVAAESVESQRKGLVLLFYPSTCTVDSVFKTLPNPEEQKLAGKFNDAMPIRVVAIHGCFPDSLFFRMFRSIMLLSYRSHTRFRFKTHVGTYSICTIQFHLR